MVLRLQRRVEFPELVVTRRLVLRRPLDVEEPECGARFVRAQATRDRPMRGAIRRKFGPFMVGHWRLYGFGLFVVEARSERTAIGTCGLKYRDAYPGHWPGRFDEVELGYSLLPEFRGCGYATEAARAVLAVAFEALDLRRITARCNLDNAASARVLARCGMRELGAGVTRNFEMLRGYSAEAVRVRRATEDDDASARLLLDEYNAAVDVIVRDDDAAIRSYLRGPGAFWLAEVDNAIAGCVALKPLANVAVDVCEVKRLYVRDLFRGIGVADRLMDALETYARDAGYSAIYLDTFEALASAVRLYERRGYERTERYNENPQATVFMRRRLR